MHPDGAFGSPAAQLSELAAPLEPTLLLNCPELAKRWAPMRTEVKAAPRPPGAPPAAAPTSATTAEKVSDAPTATDVACAALHMVSAGVGAGDDGGGGLEMEIESSDGGDGNDAPGGGGDEGAGSKSRSCWSIPIAHVHSLPFCGQWIWGTPPTTR